MCVRHGHSARDLMTVHLAVLLLWFLFLLTLNRSKLADAKSVVRA